MNRKGQGNWGGSEKKVNIQKLTLESDSEEPPESQFSDSSSSFSSGNQGQNGKNNKKKQGATATAKRDNKSQQNSAPQSQKSGQNNPQNPPDTFTAGTTELGKMAAAIEKLTSSNAQLTADINVLKSSLTETANQKPRFSSSHTTSVAPSSNLNPLVAPFACQIRPQLRQTYNNRPIYMCDACIQNQSWYCRH